MRSRVIVGVLVVMASACGSSGSTAAESDRTGGGSGSETADRGGAAMLTFGSVTFTAGAETGPVLSPDGRVEIGGRHIVTLEPDGTVRSADGAEVVARLQPDGRLEFAEPGTETATPVIAEDGTLTMRDHTIAFDASGVLTGAPETEEIRVTGLTPENRRAAMITFLLFMLMHRGEATATATTTTTTTTTTTAP